MHAVGNLNVSTFTEEQAEFDPQTVRPGSRYSHVQEVQERLNFLRYVTLRLSLISLRIKEYWELNNDTKNEMTLFVLSGSC